MNFFDEALAEFSAKKSLGQNFLVDERVIGRIVDACGLSSDETILEIGPGQGALTRRLLPQVKKIIAVEADRQLAGRLANDIGAGEALEVHHADILKFDLAQLPAPLSAVGNIPYNISTPIIARVIAHRELFKSLLITVQYEFGARLVAKPGTRDYSSLSCFVQMFAEPEMLFKIAPSAFRPSPKIQSCFMRLNMRKEPAQKVVDEALFVRVVRQAFQQRRKNLLNSLAPLSTKDDASRVLDVAGVGPQLRAGDVTVAQYARIANAYHH